MTDTDKIILEQAIIKLIRDNVLRKQSEVIDKLKGYYEKTGNKLPFACTQPQIAKLFKELNITKSTSGRYIQATHEEIALCNYLYDHTKFFDYSDITDAQSFCESNISVISDNIVIIKLIDNTAQEGCELINKATNFKVIAHASFNAITLVSTYPSMMNLFNKIDTAMSFSCYENYYSACIKRLENTKKIKYE